MDNVKMSAKQWLGRARGISCEIEILLTAKNEALDNLTRVTQRYDADGAQSSKEVHKIERLLELEEVIDKKVDELMHVKAEIVAEIGKVHNTKQRQVLLCYYVRGLSLERIAVELNCSFRNVAYLKKRGVQAVEKNRI